mmetsp:Transcript_53454/g.117056  ORF Transcript_53454/g.117056 Transcript_53454/m.117056 type:complete len:270 (+) Transcript_53454:49-858(+)
MASESEHTTATTPTAGAGATTAEAGTTTAATTTPTASTTSAEAAPQYFDVYLCRHGTTTWNLEKRWQGEKDTDLAEVGIEQARKTADILAARLTNVHHIYTSDLKRAKATAAIYAERFGCEVTEAPGLREPSLGKFEGMVKKDIYSQYAHVFDGLVKLPQEERLATAYFPELEAPNDTSLRCEAVALRAVKEVAEAAASDPSADPTKNTLLLVSHSKVLEAVLARVFGKFSEGIETEPCAFFHWRFALDGRHELGDVHDISFHDCLVAQ